MSPYRSAFHCCTLCGAEEYPHPGTWEMPFYPLDHPRGGGARYRVPTMRPIICRTCIAQPPTMRVFEAVAEGALTPEQGASLLVRKRALTWWQRVLGFLFGVLDNHVSRFP